MPGGDVVQKIKDRLNIVDVVSTYVELHKAGKNYKGKSPFTNEKTPSFYVSPDRGMYYCFSSSQGGDVFTFVQVMEGVDFKGALKILAEKAGVELVPEDPQKRTQRDQQYNVLEEATKFFEKKLLEKSEALEYLRKRGVVGETRAKWRIGYAPGPPDHGWRELKSYLEEKNFTKDDLVRAGLIKGQDTGKEPYDVFRDRIMFPIFDASGRVVAYSGRVLHPDSDAPKYVNSPETELFVKSDILYGYDRAKDGIRKLNFSLIVEGQFDVVLAHQAGYSNTVAVSGTALTAHHVELLQRLSNRVVLALDDDRAGVGAVKRAADLMLTRGMDVKVAKLKEGQDPADMIRDDVDSFRTAVKKAEPVVMFLLQVTKKVGQDARAYKLLVREEVLPYVARIPNAIDREHFAGLIAERIDTTKEAILTELEKLLAARKETKNERALIAPPKTTALSGEQLEKYAEQIFGAIDFLGRFPEGKHVIENLKRHMELILDERFHEYTRIMSDERLNHVLMQFEKTYTEFPGQGFFENLTAKLNRFHEIHLKNELTKVTDIMRTLEQSGELTEEYKKTMERAQIIHHKLQNHAILEETVLLKKD